MLYTGFQYTPVLSMATCRQSWPVSQSANSNNPRVVVEKVRTSLTARPWAPHFNRQAVTVRLCTSRPQQSVYTMRMARSSESATVVADVGP